LQLAVRNKCNWITGALHLPKGYEEHIFHKVGLAMNHRWRHGRIAEYITAACAYIVIRQNSKPLTLLDVATTIECNVFELGKVYNNLTTKLEIKQPEIDPALFIERVTSTLLNLTSEQQRAINARAIRLINIAKGEWIITGRRPGAVTIGAIALAMDADNLKCDFLKLSEILKVAPQTAKLRYNELRESLVQIGHQLPWGSDINKRNVCAHLNFILKHLEFLSKSTKSSSDDSTHSVSTMDYNQQVPPSFIRNEMKRELRAQKLQRAKERIVRSLQSDTAASNALQHLCQSFKDVKPATEHENVDEEDLAIEKLLLEGVDEAKILENSRGYYEHKPTYICETDIDPNELDIPDHEMVNYIRTPSEVELLKNLGHYSQQPSNLTLNSDEPSKRSKLS